MSLVSSLLKTRASQSWYALSWSPELDEKQLSAWLHALNGYSNLREFRIVVQAKNDKIKHYLVLPSSNERLYVRMFKTFLPDVELNLVDPIAINSNLSAKVLMTSRNRVLQTKIPETVSHSLLTSLSVLASGESLTLDWVLGKRYSPEVIGNDIKSTYSSNWLVSIGKALTESPQPLEAQALKSFREKMSSPGWKANLYIGIQAKSRHRRFQLIQRVNSALRSADAEGIRLGVRTMIGNDLHILSRPWFWSLRINVLELTGLIGFPIGDKALYGITRIKSRYLPIPNIISKNGRTLAKDKNSNRKIGLSTQDALLHTHIIGPTGVGKTTLLLNLITQDIALGNAVVVIDPKGDLVGDVLARIPIERKADVIVLDPSDTSRVVGLNPLASNNKPNSLAVDNILSIFRGLYGDNFGPRTEDILHAGLLTLARTKGMSLSNLPILYTNSDFRQKLVSNLNDPLGISGFWDWFNSISDAERTTVLAPLMNKLRAFLLRPAMRHVVSQPEPKLNIEDILNNKGILLINLAKGVLGAETAQLLGSLAVSQVWQAVQSRASLPINRRSPAFVYIDEVQDYLHLPTDIGDVLAQSRSYGVGMILAHQHLAQLSSDLKAGILGNVRSRVSFQLGHSDAVEMAKSSDVLSSSDFENLSLYNIYARVVANGATQPWVSGVTLAPPEKISNPEEIRNLSRQKYGVPLNEIDSALSKLIEGNSEVQKNDVGTRQLTLGGNI